MNSPARPDYSDATACYSHRNAGRTEEKLWIFSVGRFEDLKTLMAEMVEAFHHPRKHRTRLVGVSTDRHNRVYFRIEEFVEGLRTVTRISIPISSMARIAKG
jgi:hypothetical protein